MITISYPKAQAATPVSKPLVEHAPKELPGFCHVAAPEDAS